MLFRRTMVLEVLRTFQQDENRYTCCRRTVLSGEKGTKIGYRQGSNLGPLATGGFCPLDLPLDHAASWGLAQVGFSHRPQKFRWKGDITDAPENLGQDVSPGKVGKPCFAAFRNVLEHLAPWSTFPLALFAVGGFAEDGEGKGVPELCRHHRWLRDRSCGVPRGWALQNCPQRTNTTNGKVLHGAECGRQVALYCRKGRSPCKVGRRRHLRQVAL